MVKVEFCSICGKFKEDTTSQMLQNTQKSLSVISTDTVLGLHVVLPEMGIRTCR